MATLHHPAGPVNGARQRSATAHEPADTPSPTSLAFLPADPYSASEAAAVLACSVKSVQNMANAGILPSFRVGASGKGAFRFPRAGVEAVVRGTDPWAAVGQAKPEGRRHG